MVRNHSMIIIAHRGSPATGMKENTVESFHRAVQLGADMIETDIRQTKDGQLVCVHYPSWQGKAIRDMSYKEWSRKTQRKEGWKPALLQDLLPLLDKKYTFNVEVKEKGLEKKVLEQIPERDNILFSSFDEEIIQTIKQLDPSCRTALLVGRFDLQQERRRPFQWWRDYFPEKRLQEAQADMVCPHFRLAGPRFTARLHEQGYHVYVWTVNHPGRLKKLKTYGVDGVFTDNVEAVKRLI
ncbi:glycerophosphodiester phosphodiesterase [Salibacterium halotolerans]|uniref:Glycerophosphoryl diester phosphodiesterase n=1 Tax=Salibacterium halotolerans TaxID=1884432 RepID=A0A1I5QZY3_9BACI|nr:glycerophosphodiester phosphodiesterase [Salibacterium halotolerans]SFP51805.1 glycerophosphoryl diester phosphodiesterase [Salibacterium halotolerans]